MVTIQDVAAKAGVSVGSVSRYLNGHQLKEKNMIRIKQAIDELNYRENIFAKSLKSNRTFSIGVLMNNMQSRFSSTLIGQIEEEMDHHNYSILLNSYRNRPELLEQKIDFLTERRVDGLLIFEAEKEWQGLDKLEQVPMPVISINTELKGPNVDSIICDNRESTKEMVKKMIESTTQRLGIIAAPQTASVARERLLGALEAVREVDGSEERAELFFGDFSQQSGYHGAAVLLDQGIRTIFVTNYNMSLGVLQYIYEQKLKIGSDVLFSSFDYPNVSDIIDPRFPVIRQPVNQMGTLAVKRIFDRISEPQLPTETFVLKNELLWRDPTKHEGMR